VVLLELGLMRSAMADQWKITGALDQGLEYDDNIGLRAVKAPAFGYLLRPNVRAEWATALIKAGISASGDIRRYDDSQWNCDNFTLGADQSINQRRHVFSLRAGYSQICSYSQQSADTGILVPNNQSESFNVSPNWSWQLTPVDRINLSPSYSLTSYTNLGTGINNEVSANFRDNKSYGATISEAHDWNRRLSSNVSVFFSHSEFSSSSGILNQSTSSQNVFGGQLGGQYAISRKWSINASGGGRWVQSPGNAGNVDSGDLSFGETYNVAVNYKDRFDSYSLNFSRSVSPSAFGQIQDVSSLGLNYGYEISRELAFQASASYSENQSVGQSQTLLGQKRNFFNASAELAWKFAREWRLTASYRYRMQEYPTSGSAQTNSSLAGVRDSNAIMLHLNYNWDGLRDSR